MPLLFVFLKWKNLNGSFSPVKNHELVRLTLEEENLANLPTFRARKEVRESFHDHTFLYHP